MLRWLLTATGFAAFNQSLADQELIRLLISMDLISSSQYRVISIITSINSMQTSCFFVFRHLKSITSITGGICGSDLLSSQILASSEQVSFS